MDSGKGKTTLVMAITKALKTSGTSLRLFKCGPDYIDPLFHSKVLGVPCRNLDSFLMGRNEVFREVYPEQPEQTEQSKQSEQDSVTLIEGAMGLYDGLAGGVEHSAYDLADLLHGKVILVISDKEELIRALKRDVKHLICGWILNENAKGPDREEEFQIPCLGVFPHEAENEISSRHLGLALPEEDKLQIKINRLGQLAKEHLDLALLQEIAEGDPQEQMQKIPEEGVCPEKMLCRRSQAMPYKVCNIAVARDEAFFFYYEESLKALEYAGARLLYFSPLHDEKIPAEADALYMGGGYPERFAKELSENTSMRASVKQAVQAKMPTLAECGGFMYLCDTMEGTDGVEYPMVGVFSETFSGKQLKAKNTGRLNRFGYHYLAADRKDVPYMLMGYGERIPVHSFHYWDVEYPGEDFILKKAGKDRVYFEGYSSDSLYAGFPHLCLHGELPLASRFVRKAAAFGAHRKWMSLAKPLGGLGHLEKMMEQMAGIRGYNHISIDRPVLFVCCSDNGVVKEGISQADASVTTVVAEALAKGESTANILARGTGCAIVPVDCGMKTAASWEVKQLDLREERFMDREDYHPVLDRRIGSGTKNIKYGMAMDPGDVYKAVSNGMDLVIDAVHQGSDLILTGEMGIGNTTTAAAVTAALCGVSAEVVTGPGAGLPREKLSHKCRVVQEALEKAELTRRAQEESVSDHGNVQKAPDPLTILSGLGGFDIATLTGIFLGARENHVPVLVDGVITMAAAVLAIKICPDVEDFIFLTHRPKEPAAKYLMEHIHKEPFMDGDFHLGEGTGALLALPSIKMALELFNSNHDFGKLGIDAYVDYGEQRFWEERPR